MTPPPRVFHFLFAAFLTTLANGIHFPILRTNHMNVIFNIKSNHTTEKTELVRFKCNHQNRTWQANEICKWSKLEPPPVPNDIQVTLNLPFSLSTLQATANIKFKDDFNYYDEEMDMTTPQIISRKQYPVEIHEILTADGYILELHRIPNFGKPPVLLLHGLLCSSAVWILAGPEKGLPYILWREGFDVWLGNFRGNEYSRKHDYLSPNEYKFWDHSFHEMGVFDISAQIDYILRETKMSEINCIGHSMGTTALFVLVTERPEYNLKIRQLHAFAPAIILSWTRSLPLGALNLLKDRYNGTEIMPDSRTFFRTLGQRLCAREDTISQTICSTLLYTPAKFTPEKPGKLLLPLALAHVQSGTSMKTLIHFAQLELSGYFCKYDYGWHENLAHYNSRTPPDYDLSKITTPVYLYCCAKDWLINPQDVIWLHHRLPNSFVYRVPDDKFNHADFLWGTDAPNHLYTQLIMWLKSNK